MPDNLLTLTDLLADSFDVSDTQASDLLNDAPLIRLLTMIESSNGTTHKYSKKVGAPVVGFRNPNTGRSLSKSNKVPVTATLEILDFTSQIDVAVAKANPKKSAITVVEEEALEHLAEALAVYERQLINGLVLGDSEGFGGFADSATLANTDSEMVVDAGGTAADAATSVYGVRLMPGGIRGVYKGDGEPFEVEETSVVKVDDGTGESYPAFYTPGTAWLGIEMGSKFSVGRVCNVTDEDGHRLTDKLLAKLYAKFPSGKKPTHWVMNRDAHAMLQESRTATNPTGKEAPFPENVHGADIVPTDSIGLGRATVGRRLIGKLYLEGRDPFGRQDASRTGFVV